jgi:hypothetical protein
MFGVGDIARAFTNLGSGLAHGIGGLGRKIKKFGEADDPTAPANRSLRDGSTRSAARPRSC